LIRSPSFLTDLYVNYDGNLSSQTHLFESLIRFLAKHTLPDATPAGPVTTPTHQILCLDGLLLFVSVLAERKVGVKIASPALNWRKDENELPTAYSLRYNKQRKRVLKEGAERFNEKPSEGIKFLQEHNFLPDPVDPVSLARFLKTTPSVNKTLLGDYLSKPKNAEILKAFVNLMDFRGGKRIDEALRLLLESFRLPGEAQQIGTIMELFAETYFDVIKDQEDHEIENQDAAYVLAYSVIMLNTDQHNPVVRRRMTLEDFMRNSRGINNGRNFSPEYLKQIYTAIKHNEIVMPEEHEGDLGFNYQWKELLKQAEVSEPFLEARTSVYDRDMFLAVWSPVLAAITYAFDNAEDDLTLQKSVVGFHHLAAVAAHHRLTEVLDTVVISLAKVTGLLRGTDRPVTTGVGDEGRKTVDRWAVDIGRNYRGLIAAVLMFTFAREW
ncbi:GDP/GTP exchange factor for ARF, partial [Borealophlyctis nickersoniae]